jgi:hypothetical protein
MDALAAVDGEAVKLLTQARYVWNYLIEGFQRKRRIGRETPEQYVLKSHIIYIEQLAVHHLVDPPISAIQPSLRQRQEGLKWLAGLIAEHSRS